jgi:preprotein translocase subunit SecE
MTQAAANPLAKLLKFGRDVRTEAGRITWPKRQDTQRMTIMVFILVTLIALFLVAVDLLIGFGFSHLFGLTM